MATYISAITTTASTEKVFNALTDPELVKQWQYGRELITDWKVGGKIRFSTGSGSDVLEQWGTVLDMRTNELIKYNLFTPGRDLEDKIENYCVTSYVLTKNKGKTKIEIIQEDHRPGGFAPQTLERILVLLKEVAESN